MKLLRVGPKGLERPAILDDRAGLRDLGGVVPDFEGAGVGFAALDRIRAIDPFDLPVLDGDPRIGPCLLRANFLTVGLNYLDLAKEAGMTPPAEPLIAAKAPSALAGPHDPLVIPKGALKVDWEVELAVIIGAEAEHLSERDALSVVAGYCVINDLADRAWQLETSGQWVKGKSAPGFGPLGPWLVTADEVSDPQDLSLWLDLNGETMQLSNTRHMIFSVAQIIACISRYMRLMPGDVIATGSPAGVGMVQKPPRYLRDGDILDLGVDGLGAQRQVCVAWPGAAATPA
ncbi:MAG: 2-keto-4-pentenoate hydratase/2-oxohepta-3-ene-1,7-dioic acid hydratase in catechol pathway [Paracoccaceae bacterium]|jgi:2-keto-4-pentenoate hydratase/2-oxohepta-3-ene-1,7-dioic acid hydratase in catechol pathway